ncbi:DUF4231 domain-containing protein [Aquimarina sp. AD10]|uniref:DUF4231 domain-containing protein n=1 Tax=Aquimarina aggregata TaxID=1642818 RepID=A0A163CF18_9FLAO|nr:MULTISPECIES: DUF4231 domain-containing protein [Aquimarina]AXT59670.1 DUF4231 domain-containing protein [Aquimarina sp. AD10]KZS42345.1 hypothetical protein AWE51_02580 [Aquimarina aggregata]RKM97546.1 DUF4231 domain-containing protein [Aquimarina sp. AD10]
MHEDEYLKERVEVQIRWYDKKSAKNKKLHFTIQGCVIVFSSLIPFFSGFSKNGPDYINYVIGSLGMLVAILAGISALVKYHEKWVKYRTTSESLKHEKFMYLTRSGHYKDEKNYFNVFVGRVEALISSENSTWSDIMKEDV